MSLLRCSPETVLISREEDQHIPRDLQQQHSVRVSCQDDWLSWSDGHELGEWCSSWKRVHEQLHRARVYHHHNSSWTVLLCATAAEPLVCDHSDRRDATVFVLFDQARWGCAWIQVCREADDRCCIDRIYVMNIISVLICGSLTEQRNGAKIVADLSFCWSQLLVEWVWWACSLVLHARHSEWVNIHRHLGDRTTNESSLDRREHCRWFRSADSAWWWSVEDFDLIHRGTRVRHSATKDSTLLEQTIWVQREEGPCVCRHLSHRYRRPETHRYRDQMRRVILQSGVGTPSRRYGHSSLPFIQRDEKREREMRWEEEEEEEEESANLCRGVMPWMSVMRMTLSVRWGWQVNMRRRSSMDPWEAARCTGVERSSCWSSMEPPFCKQISTASMLPPMMVTDERERWFLLFRVRVEHTDDWRVEWSMIFGVTDIQKMFCIISAWFCCAEKYVRHWY